MIDPLFESHDLVFTQDPATREYVGGGYLLNSELLNCGAPAFMTGGRRPSKRSKAASVLSSKMNSSGDSESEPEPEPESGKAGAKARATKVSDLLHNGNKRVLAIPAGIFLIKSATTAKQPATSTAAASFSSTYDDTRIRAMFDGDDNNSDDNNSDDNNSDDNNSDDNNSNKGNKDKPAVISEDLYSKLFKMLAPNDADRKRYWVSAATTCRVRNGIGKCSQERRDGVVPASSAPVPANKKTRRNRRVN